MGWILRNNKSYGASTNPTFTLMLGYVHWSVTLGALVANVIDNLSENYF